MKIAILSDLHSNLGALTACRDHALARGAGRFVCLGDCVGYGADPAATLDLLVSLPGVLCVLGNNDEYVASPGVGEFPNEYVRRSAEWTRARLRPDQLAYLGSLTYLQVEDGVTYVHASVNSPERWSYVLEPAQARACLKAAVTDVVFFGHVHLPYVFEATDRRSDITRRSPAAGETVRFQTGRQYVVCVGSVGQPRDGDPRACYVLYDSDARTITFERVTYDHAAAAHRIREAGLPAFFAERLESGR
jgi:diadenosine tetraphosphatase ApaH/serine/threonine PP2A family protein phosphatase